MDFPLHRFVFELASLGPLAELRSLVDAVYGRALKADTAQRRLRWRGRRHANDTHPAFTAFIFAGHSFTRIYAENPKGQEK